MTEAEERRDPAATTATAQMIIEEREKPAPAGLAVVFLSVFIDVFAGLLAVPVLPYLVLADAGGAADLAWASAMYQLGAMLATPLVGWLSDKYGRRPFFLCGFLGSGVGSFLIARSAGLPGILVGRFVGGLFSTSMPLAQAYISDVVAPAESGKYRARLGAVFMSAMVFAPGFGGGLAQFGLTFPFYCAAGLSWSGFFVCWQCYQEPRRRVGQRGKRAAAAAAGRGRTNSLAETERAVALAQAHRPLILRLFLAGFFGTFSLRVFVMMLGLWTARKFGWGAGEFGFSVSVAGIVGILANLALFVRLQARLGRHGTCIAGAAIAGVGWAIATFSRDSTTVGGGGTFVNGPLVFLAGQAVQAVGHSLYSTALGTLLSSYAPAASQGAVQGTNYAVSAVAGLLGPLAGGYLFTLRADLPLGLGEWDFELLPLVSSASYFVVALLVWRVLALSRRLPEHHKRGQTASTASVPTGVVQSNPASFGSTRAALAVAAGVELTGAGAQGRGRAALTEDERDELARLRLRVAELEAVQAKISSKLGSLLSADQVDALGLQAEMHHHHHHHH